MQEYFYFFKIVLLAKLKKEHKWLEVSLLLDFQQFPNCAYSHQVQPLPFSVFDLPSKKQMCEAHGTPALTRTVV